MKFDARHVSFEEINWAWVLALADSLEPEPQTFVIISFSDEDEQDRALGLTGLYLESSGAGSGYGRIESMDYDGRALSIALNDGGTIEAVVATDMMAPEAISDAVAQCNTANASRMLTPVPGTR